MADSETLVEENDYDMMKDFEDSMSFYSIIKLVVGIVMTAIGFCYQNDCDNGAANWLGIAGIVVLVSSGLHLLGLLYSMYAKSDGEISCGETCVMMMNKILIGIVVIVEVVVIIWGCVVVFGAWGSWVTDDDDSENYCNKVPFITALSILFIQLILVPLFACIKCCWKVFCCGCGE